MTDQVRDSAAFGEGVRGRCHALRLCFSFDDCKFRHRPFGICSQHALAVMLFHQALYCCHLVDLMQTLSRVMLALRLARLVSGAIAPNVSLLEHGMIRDERSGQ